MALAGFVIPLLLGWFIVDLATRGHAASRSVLMRLALAVGAGFGCSSIIGFIALLAGVTRIQHVVELLAAFGFALLAKRNRMDGAAPSVRQRLPLVFLCVALLASSIVLVAGSISSRFGYWDAWAMWMLRARFIDLLGSSWGGWFAGPGHLLFDHADYPFLVPTIVGTAWRDAGSESPIISHAVMGLFDAAIVALLFAALDQFVGRIAAAAGTMALLSITDFALVSSGLLADVPFSFYVLATVVLLTVAAIEQSPPGIFVLAGLMAGLSTWTKNEGWPLLAGSLLALALFSRTRQGLKARPFSFLAGSAAPLLLTLFFKIRYAGSNDLVSGQGQARTLARLIDVSRYVTIAHSAFWYLNSHRSAVLSLLVGLILLGGQRRWWKAGETAAGGITIATIAVAYAAAYVTTPNDLKWQLATSLARLALHLWPSVLFILMFVFATRDAEASRT